MRKLLGKRGDITALLQFEGEWMFEDDYNDNSFFVSSFYYEDYFTVFLQHLHD